MMTCSRPDVRHLHADGLVKSGGRLLKTRRAAGSRREYGSVPAWSVWTSLVFEENGSGYFEEQADKNDFHDHSEEYG